MNEKSQTTRGTAGRRSKKRPASLLFALLTAAALTLLAVCPAAAEKGEEMGETLIIHVDSVNGTRWENTTCVYIGRANTEQNEWGYNIVVSAEGVVTKKILPGDSAGRNLAIPDGGFVFSSVADEVKKQMDGIEIGDRILFDSYCSRVLISKGEIDPFYEVSGRFTGYNAVRYENTLIVYNRGGTTTGTNGWGYEVTVGRDGIVTVSGGNDSPVPEGGFVLSAIEPEDRAFLRTYCIPGAKVTLGNGSFTVYYGPEMLADTVRSEIALMREQIDEAEKEFRLVDTAAVREMLDAVEYGDIRTLEERNAIIDRVQSLNLLLVEPRTVGARSVWYVPTETTAEAVHETVTKMKETGINQVCLGISNGYDTIVRLPKRFPFSTRNSVKDVDLLAVYAKECHAAGIELVVSMPVFSCPDKDYAHNKWLALVNRAGGKAERFYSPANEEFMDYLKEYVEYVVTRYDIDGFQYDYIRYPYFDGTYDYGYDEATKALFLQETGLQEDALTDISEKLRSSKYWKQWVQFKRDLITRRVGELTALIREKRPDLYISACLADDTAEDSYCQDGKAWMDKGYVDGIYPMSYGEGIMGNSTAKFRRYVGENNFLIMGCGAYMSFSQAEVTLQTKQTRQGFADGIAYFEWSAYLQHGYAETMRETVYAKDCVSFTYAESESVRALTEVAEERFARYGGKDVSALFGSESSPEKLKEALLAEVPYDEKLYYDLDLAIRLEAFSREEYKETVELLPHETDPEEPEESGETDVSAESGEAESAEDPGSEPEQGGRAFPWKWVLIGCGAAALVVAAAVALKLKQTKRKPETDDGKK